MFPFAVTDRQRALSRDKLPSHGAIEFNQIVCNVVALITV